MKKHIVIIAIALLLLIMFNLPACQTNESSALVQSDQSSLGQQLVFSKGYHLVTAYEYNTDAFVKIVYICQSDDDKTDYRICIPETK